MTRSFFLSILWFALSGAALAAPGQIAHQGRLLDGDDLPVDGVHSLRFALYDDTDTLVWEETHTVDLINGFYSAILGADDSGNPLDTSLLAGSPLTLEITVDGGDPMEPRQDLVSVPYAILATTSTHVDGGTVDATEIRINGDVVVDTGGAWVGETPSVDWTEINGVPLGFADDLDADTLLDLSCQDGEIAAWDDGLLEWVCALDLDTLLTEAEVETYLTNGALDLDAGTTLGGAAISTGAHTVDTDTQLSEADVDAMADNNGYSTGAHTVDTDTQLSEAQVDAFADNNGYSMGAHTVDTDTQLSEAQVDAFADNNGYSTGVHTVDTNTQLSEGQVETYVTNGALDLDSGTTLGGAAISTGAHTSAGPGTVFYTRCAWTENPHSSIGSCTPPACPTTSGWSDLGITGNVKTETTAYGYHNSEHPESAGYQERACHSSTSYAVVTTRCAWTGSSDSTIGTCTPPACPSGWSDLGATGNVKTAVMGYGYWNSTHFGSAGYQERTCLQ